MPTAKALTCNTAKPGRAATWRVAKISQRGAVCSFTDRRSAATANHARPAKKPRATAKPATATPPIRTSRLTTINKAQNTTTPVSTSARDAGCICPTSRRITRKGGTLASCNMGATPKAAIRLRPTPMPVSAGHIDGGGKDAFTNPDNNATKTQWTDHPTATPIKVATNPTAKNSSMNARAMVRCETPNTRNMAHASSCVAAKPRAPMATATAHSNAVSIATKFKNFSARSSVSFVPGRPDSRVSRRKPSFTESSSRA